MKPCALVVDDSLTVRMDLVEAFEAADFRALPGATLAEARRLLAVESVDVVVLDVLLPDGDGIDLLRELRGSNGAQSALPVILLSTEAEVADRIRGLATGADEYVGKPYRREYVVARARELTRRGSARAEPERRSVLVIDDSATARDELSRALDAAGYDVATAESGEDGLRLAAALRPSAVIVDGALPGIDGAAVIRRLRLDAALRRVPCLLLTASEERDAELHALDAGADAFVRKGEALEVVLARLTAAMRGAALSADSGTASVLGPKRILAVDDSPTYLNELATALGAEGYDVVLARSGEEAVELLSAQPVDCILLDVVMPGLGGQETCRRIKAAPLVRDIPLLMLTAVEDRASMLQGLGAGADDYIPKSSDFEVLKARVRAQLRRRQLEDEHRRVREELMRQQLEAAESAAARELAETRAALVEELERKNRELEAFSYSVSHDLRAPLRGIDGFSQALLEDYSGVLDERGRDYLGRVRAAAQRMAELIDDLLQLSRIGRAQLRREPVDLSALAREVVEELRRAEPERALAVEIEPGLVAEADPQLVRVALENLIGNAVKFTSRTASPRIEIGGLPGVAASEFYVRDNGAGFDMNYAERLFRPFQRLHSDAEFAGTGIGLATVQRVVDRHGGRVWAEGGVGRGATFRFTLERARGGLE